MRVFVECAICGEKTYLNEVHETPAEYPPQLELECPNGHVHFYGQQDLQAEKGGNAAAAGVILGGLVGSLGGPAGAVVGAGVGGALGQNQNQQEEERVEQFNTYFYGA